MITGSLRKVLVDGIPFNVAADANASKTPIVSKEGIPHSGGNAIKIMKMVGNVEGLTLIIDPDEYETLQDKAGLLSSIPLSYEQADGKSWTSPGHINLDNYESEEGRIDITMIPESGTWSLFG